MGRRKARDISFKYVYATLYGNQEVGSALESIMTVSEEEKKALEVDEKEYFDKVAVRYKRKCWTNR